jgi:hypothetical protein
LAWFDDEYSTMLDIAKQAIEEAIEQYQTALAIFRAIGDQQGEVMVLNNLGTPTS